VVVFIQSKLIQYNFNLYGEDVESMEDYLNKCHAFDDPEEGVLGMDF